MTTKDKYEYIAGHYGSDKSLKELVEYTGYTENYVIEIASRLRKEGRDIPNYKKDPIGTITERKTKGVTYQCIKTESGWRRVKGSGTPKPVAKPKPKPKQVVVKIRPAKTRAPTDPRKPDYQAQGKVIIKQDDLVNNYYHKRDSRTYVLTARK